MKIKLIESAISDSADYEIFYNQVIQNTLKKYFKQCDEQNINAQFIKTYGDDLAHGLKLSVYVEFENKQDMAIFKLMNNEAFPLTKLTEGDMQFTG